MEEIATLDYMPRILGSRAVCLVGNGFHVCGSGGRSSAFVCRHDYWDRDHVCCDSSGKVWVEEVLSRSGS